MLEGWYAFILFATSLCHLRRLHYYYSAVYDYVGIATTLWSRYYPPMLPFFGCDFTSHWHKAIPHANSSNNCARPGRGLLTIPFLYS